MKRDFAERYRCRKCRRNNWTVIGNTDDAREIREGSLVCDDCSASYPIKAGVVDFLDREAENLNREIAGWIEMAGPLGDHLVPTMTALPYYPHDPWLQVGPDFFQIFEQVDLRGKTVVDLGAGRTWSSRYLKAYGQSGEVIAIDVLPTRYIGLETSDIYFQEDGIYYERIQGDVHEIPLNDAVADVVFSCATLHHSSDLGAVAGEIWRILRPGGVFVSVCELSKNASVKETSPDSEETRHGINERLYHLWEYLAPLRRRGFRIRRLVPRSIGYRLIYPDQEFRNTTPRIFRYAAGRPIGRSAISFLLRCPGVGRLLYRWWTLPVSFIASKPASARSS